MATAKLETVNTDDITLDWLKENKPELVEAMMEDDSDESEDTEDTSGEGAAAESYSKDDENPAGAEMSATPATLAQLESLGGATPEFVIGALKASLSLPDAMAKLNKQLVDELAEARKKATLSAEAGGADPVSRKPAAGGAEPKAALSGTDPAKDWASCEQLRKQYTAECGGNEQLGQTAFLRAAHACLSAGESYLDMLPDTVKG